MNCASLVSIPESACTAIKANLKGCFISSDVLPSFPYFIFVLVLCAHMNMYFFLWLFRANWRDFCSYTLWQSLFTLLKDKFEKKLIFQLYSLKKIAKKFFGEEYIQLFMKYTVIFFPVMIWSWVGPWMPDLTKHLFSSLWWNYSKCQRCSPVQVLAWAVCKGAGMNLPMKWHWNTFSARGWAWIRSIGDKNPLVVQKVEDTVWVLGGPYTILIWRA